MAAIELNVLAKDLANAQQVMDASAGTAYVGVMVKHFPSVAAAIEQVDAYQAAGVRVSVGLGAGDPAMWRKVVDVAVATKPVHVNQVLPAAGLTLGSLQVAGATNTLVNALIAPGSEPGLVRVGTGPLSASLPGEVSCDQAAAMLAEVGLSSVKFYPIGGDAMLDHLAAMVAAAVRVGVPVFEPTGGIDLANFDAVITTCLEAGATHVMPHLYSSIIDSESGNTRPEDVAQLFEQAARLA